MALTEGPGDPPFGPSDARMVANALATSPDYVVYRARFLSDPWQRAGRLDLTRNMLDPFLVCVEAEMWVKMDLANPYSAANLRVQATLAEFGMGGTFIGSV